MGWKRFVRNYFTFNKRELRGIYVLVILLVGVVGVRAWIAFVPPEFKPLSDEHRRAFQDLQAALEKPVERQRVASKEDTISTESHSDFKWRPFDPNQVSKEFLVASGLPDWLANRVVKFREKVRPFQTALDLMEVYDMDTGWYEEAEPYIRIAPPERPEEEPAAQAANPTVEVKTKALIELNSTDTTELKSIPGIGSYFAREIVALRARFGGFSNYDQLMDIYYMNDETLSKLVTHTRIDTSMIQKININEATLRELTAHPYLGYQQAQTLINYRGQHGGFKKKREVLKTRVIPDSVYAKLAPYIRVR